MLWPVLSSSALGFVSIKPGNLQLYLKTTCLSGSVHNTFVSSLEVIPWGLHSRLLAICPRLKGIFSGSVQRNVCLLQSRHPFSNNLWWNHCCASLACYVPLALLEIPSIISAPWVQQSCMLKPQPRGGNDPHGFSSVIGPASPAHNLKGWVETPLEEFQRLVPLT